VAVLGLLLVKAVSLLLKALAQTALGNTCKISVHVEISVFSILCLALGNTQKAGLSAQLKLLTQLTFERGSLL
jgi:hypothetical protein